MSKNLKIHTLETLDKRAYRAFPGAHLPLREAPGSRRGITEFSPSGWVLLHLGTHAAPLPVRSSTGQAHLPLRAVQGSYGVFCLTE
jgi:hypothetical protein